MLEHKWCALLDPCLYRSFVLKAPTGLQPNHGILPGECLARCVFMACPKFGYIIQGIVQ
jgi:hypothetical protein